jgi:tape measure domain-containing protein
VADDEIVARLRVVGQAAFGASMRAAAASMRGLTAQTSAAARESTRLGRATASAAAEVRRYRIPLAAAGVAGGLLFKSAVETSFQFNKSIDQATVRISLFADSSKQTRKIMGGLRRLQLTRPMFDLPTIANAGAYLGNAGVAAKNVVPYIKGLTNASIAAGGGAESLERIARAVGQIQARGTVGAEELNQLSDAGINVRKPLMEAFNLTRAQMKNIGQEGISSKAAVKVMVDYFNSGKVKEAASRMLKTTAGQWDAFKNNVTVALGAIGRPVYKALRGPLQALNKRLMGFTKWAQSGALEKGIDALVSGATGKPQIQEQRVKKMPSGGKILLPGGGMEKQKKDLSGFEKVMKTVGEVGRTAFQAVAKYVGQFFDALKPAKPFLDNVLIPFAEGFAKGALGGLLFILKAAIPIVRIFSTALGWIGEKAKPLRPLIEAVGTVLGVIFGPSLLSVISAISRLSILLLPLRIAIGILRVPFRLVGLAIRGVVGVVKLVIRYWRFWFNVIRGAPGFIARVVTGIIGKLRALPGAVLRIVTRVANFFKELPGKIRRWAGGIGAAFLAAITSGFSTVWRGIKGIGGKIIHMLGEGVKGAVGFLADAISGVIDALPGGNIFGWKDKLKGLLHLNQRALGGVVQRGEVTLVGERGPEIASFPPGTRITPLRTPSVSRVHLNGDGASALPPIITHVFLDRRQIATAVAQDTADRQARR